MRKRHTPMTDPIVKEIREVKRRLAARFKYDVVAMLKDAQRRQAHSGHKVIAPRRKRPVPSNARRAAAPIRRG